MIKDVYVECDLTEAKSMPQHTHTHTKVDIYVFITVAPNIWLTVMEYLRHQWWRKHSVCRNNNMVQGYCPHSLLITGFVGRITWRVQLVEQELLILLDHLSSSTVVSGFVLNAGKYILESIEGKTTLFLKTIIVLQLIVLILAHFSPILIEM